MTTASGRTTDLPRKGLDYSAFRVIPRGRTLLSVRRSKKQTDRINSGFPRHRNFPLFHTRKQSIHINFGAGTSPLTIVKYDMTYRRDLRNHKASPLLEWRHWSGDRYGGTVKQRNERVCAFLGWNNVCRRIFCDSLHQLHIHHGGICAVDASNIFLDLEDRNSYLMYKYTAIKYRYVISTFHYYCHMFNFFLKCNIALIFGQWLEILVGSIK